MNPRWLITTLAAILVLAVVSACGGDDNAPSTSASATSTATATGDAPEDSKTPKPTSTSKKTATPKDTGTAEPTGTGVNDSTPEIDECRLVTLNEISAATGEQFTADGTLTADRCSYDGANGTNVELRTFNLSSYGAGHEKEFFETFATVFGADILDSPGDEAYYDDTTGLSILSGKYELDVVVTKSDGSSDRAATFALAQKAIPNMP